jgi:predicted lipid-binding transport protein (Tim44 family)
MNLFLDFTSLIFLVIAVVIFWRLRSVLGTRTGTEKPPIDPFAKKPADIPPPAGDNVITLPRGPRPAEDEANAAGERVDAIAPSGTALNAALRSIIAADRSFDAETFLSGARTAYEMIVSAYAAGDRDSLKALLSRDVYDGFVGAIADREKRGETVDFTFVGIDKADIVEAAMKGGSAQVTVRFVSQLISVTRNRAGEVVDGDPAKVTDVHDVWTFSREVRSADPNWRLIATEVEG